MDNRSAFAIILMAVIIGILVVKLRSKRREDIIKMMVKRDQLPPASNDAPWIENGVCYMSDGTTGKVKGRYCEQLMVL